MDQKAETIIENQETGVTRRGAMAVVLSADRKKVLLLRREIFILWDLPGGAIEAGEDPADAAVRECREETGYIIEIERLTGRYRHQSVYGRGDQLTYAYRAHTSGGTPKRFGLEITGLRWCALPDFPSGFQPLHRQIVRDALEDPPTPFIRRIDFPRWQLYPARVAFIGVYLISKTLRWFLKPRKTQ